MTDIFSNYTLPLPQLGNANPNCEFSRWRQDLDDQVQEVFLDDEHLLFLSFLLPRPHPEISQPLYVRTV